MTQRDSKQPSNTSDDRSPQWWSDKSKKIRQNARSRTQERQVAKATGGRVQAGSGSSWRASGDVATPTDLIQHKGTEAKSYSIKLAEFLELESQALRAGKDALFLVEFADGTVLAVTRWR